MKNYIQRIIRLFATSDPDPKLTGEIHRWLLDQEHAGEKETALHDLWYETDTWLMSVPGVGSDFGIYRCKRIPGSPVHLSFRFVP